MLPLDLLVAVRKKLRREGDAAGVVVALGGGVDEGTGVGEERHFTGVEEGVELCNRRMETPRTAVGGAWGEGEDAGLGNREVGAGGFVGGVAGAEGDNEIIGVVATVEEKADQGFVIGGDRGAGDRRELRAVGGAGGGTHEAEAAEGREQAGGTDGGAASVAEEFAAGDFGGGLFAHGRREGGRDEERGETGETGNVPRYLNIFGLAGLG